MTQRVSIIVADITTLDVDAIVNAANSSLLGGGGVDGAIHRAAGPDLEFECRMLNGCKVGETKMTKGYRLPAKFIIHTVGPVWNGGKSSEHALLASCYATSLQLAAKHALDTIAFPSISTGVYRFPAEAAAKIAVGTVAAFLKESAKPSHVTLCCFSPDAAALHRAALAALGSEHD